MLKQQVKQILEQYPETRNNDITLTIKLWEVYYELEYRVLLKGTIHSLYYLPYQDNIKRYRAMFQAKGQYLPTDWKIAKQRRIKEDVWRRSMGYIPVQDKFNISNL